MAVTTQDDHDSDPRCAQFHAAAAIAIGALAIIRLMFDIVGSVTSRISHTTIDSRNAHQQSLWWSQVLSMREDPEDPNEPATRNA